MSANPIRIRIDGSGSCEPLAPQAAAEKLTPGQAWTPPTSAEALAALAQAGIPVFVDNGALFVANETDTDGRPLSASRERLREMAREREPFYRRASQVIVDNSGPLEQTVAEILTDFGGDWI